jgi:predicted MFS family arabinose efflux permease
MSDAPAPYPGYGSKSYRAYALGVLLVVYVFNFIDRSLISVVQEALKRDLQIGDFELGLLGGPAFAILYGLMGIPIARYAERHNRITIVALGAAVWSAMTTLSGFAGNFLQLALARIGVGIGEAACTPPSHSVISDYFPASRRASALSIWGLGIPIGTMLAAVGGAWFVATVGWRWAFWLLGAPGLIVALVLKFTVREPPRAGAGENTPSFSETLAAIARKASFWHMAAGGALMALVGYSTAQFLISYFARVFLELGPEIEDRFLPASLAFGAIAGFAVTAGTFLGGFASDRLSHKHPRVYSWLPTLGVLLALPFYLLSFLQTSFWPAFAFLMVAPIFHYLYLGPGFAVVQSIAPPRMRATSTALLLLIINLIGYGLGPPIMGALSDYFANQVLAPEGLSTGVCAQMAADARGSILPTRDLGAAFMSLLSGQPAPPAPRVAIPDGAQISACAPAIAHGLKYAMMCVVALLPWPALHFWLAGRTLQKDRVS